MEQPVTPGTSRRPQPPPLPVSLRLEAEPFHRLPEPLLRDIWRRLTNSSRRGDTNDQGLAAGSHMRNVIDDFFAGFGDDGDWAVTCWPVGSRFNGPVAWCHLHPVASSFEVGYYCDPAWRRRHLGRLLVDECTRLAHRMGHRRLVAHPWNATSHAFFQGAGFTCEVKYASDISGLSELEVPEVLPPRPPLRCRPPEAP